MRFFGESNCKERSVSSPRTAHRLGQLTLLHQSGEYFTPIRLPHGKVFLDDVHRGSHPFRFLPPTLVFLLSPSLRSELWVMGYRALLLWREFLRGDRDPEQDSRWSYVGSKILPRWLTGGNLPSYNRSYRVVFSPRRSFSALQNSSSSSLRLRWRSLSYRRSHQERSEGKKQGLRTRSFLDSGVCVGRRGCWRQDISTEKRGCALTTR